MRHQSPKYTKKAKKRRESKPLERTAIAIGYFCENINASKLSITQIKRKPFYMTLPSIFYGTSKHKETHSSKLMVTRGGMLVITKSKSKCMPQEFYLAWCRNHI